MATLNTDVGAPYTPAAVNLATAQTGTGPTTNSIDRGGRTGPALLQIITTVGATPTCTYAIEGSADGSSWFNIPYATPAAPGTVAVANVVITSATTTNFYLLAGFPWRHVRLTLSANTNVTSTINVFFF